MTLDAYFEAAQRGDLPGVRRMANTMAGQTDEDHSTALMKAAQMNHKDIVKFLLKFEQNMVDAQGRKAINYAYDSGAEDTYAILRDAEIMEDADRLQKELREKRVFLAALRRLNERRAAELAFKMWVFRLLFFVIIGLGIVFVFTSFLE